MSRLNRQDDAELVEKLTYLNQSVKDARAVQSFGASNVQTYRLFNQTANSDITLTNLTTTTPQGVEFTVTPRSAVSNPVIVFDFGFQFTSSVGYGSVTTSTVTLAPVAGVQKFRLYVLAQGVNFPDLSIAGAFWTISNGTYTVVKL